MVMRQQRIGGRLSLSMGCKHKWRCCYLSQEKPRSCRWALNLILLRLALRRIPINHDG